MKLKFAVIGCGSLAQSQHIPNLLRSQKAELYACVDSSSETLEHCRRQFNPAKTYLDYHLAIADPSVQAICLCTTERLRLPVIAAAAAAGKAVYVEKPLARSWEEIKEIQRVVRAAGIKVCVGHNRRSSPAMLMARELWQSHRRDPQPCPWRYDREGQKRPALAQDKAALMAVRINDDWHSWKRWVFDPEQAPHGPMLFEMTHFTDLCNWFIGTEPIEVCALDAGPLNSGVVIRYADDSVATIAMGANGTFGYPKELYEIMGHGAIIAIDHMLEVRTAGIAGAAARTIFPPLNDRHPDIGVQGGLSGWLAKKAQACSEAEAAGNSLLQFTAEPDKGHARALDRFVDEILGTGPEVCGVEAAALATRVAFAAIRSTKERRTVRIEEI